MASEEDFTWKEELVKMEVGWEEGENVLNRRKHVQRKDRGTFNKMQLQGSGW